MTRMDWFCEARFGMFIHWGIFSLLGRDVWVMDEEHIPDKEYSRLAGRFAAKKFDAEEWVSMAKSAGMKYIVFTSKHHDGYCMFDSKLTDYTSMRSPAKCDFVKELADACHRADMKFMLYYSQMDWHHPAYQQSRMPGTPVHDEYVAYFHGQVRELCTNYGEIAGIWFDGEWGHTAEQWHMDQLIDMIRTLQPTALVNDRLGIGERGTGGDFTTAEQYVPTAAPEIGAPTRPWESNMTMNDSWGYFKADKNWKSARQLIHNLARCVSGNGNYLLNIGPRPDGTVPVESVRRLGQIGEWMGRNSASIYGAGKSPFGRGTLGVWTAKDETVYLHAFRWPGKEICVAEVKGAVRNASLLATGELISFSQEGERVFLTNLPATAPDPYDDTVIALELDHAPSVQTEDVTQRQWH